MLTLIIFIAVLAVLVISHEFGHFIAARKSGMRVYEFGFGFPPRLFGVYKDVQTKKNKIVWGKKREQDAINNGSGTLYSINLLPLGGFVKIKGEEGDEIGPDSFVSKPVWQKAVTLVAGVAMNLLLAIALLSVGFMIGLPQTTDNVDPKLVSERHLEIMQVLPDKPAQKAGLKAGDTIVSLSGLQNPKVKELQKYVDTHKTDEIPVVVERDNQLLQFKIKPIVYEDTGKGGLGIAIVEVGIVRYPWYKAIYYGFTTTGIYLKEIIVGLYILLSGLMMGKGGGAAVSGPIGIAVMTGQAARLGAAYLIQFTALLSVNLALINILPIPALDGGRLLFLLIGKIRGKPAPMKYEQVAHLIGFALLMLLIVFVTVHDMGAFKGAFIDLFRNIF